jgi:predicted MFS family arabinose efflux permease
MLTQLGYASGLFLLVPLGDRVDRKRLIIALLACNMVSLLAVAVAPNFNLLKLASFAVGASAVSAQIIIPTMSGLADPSLRGRVVGTLLSGLSAGLLFARTLSGFVGASEGWRMMFFIAVAIDVLVMAVIILRFPSTGQATSLPYTALLCSLWTLFKGEPTVRAACVTGFLMFAAFSALWSTLAMLMARPPYDFGPAPWGHLASSALPVCWPPRRLAGWSTVWAPVRCFSLAHCCWWRLLRWWASVLHICGYLSWRWR